MAMSKDKSTETNQQYWTFVEETSREVEKWPAWLRAEAQAVAVAKNKKKVEHTESKTDQAG